MSDYDDLFNKIVREVYRPVDDALASNIYMDFKTLNETKIMTCVLIRMDFENRMLSLFRDSVKSAVNVNL